jgi:hypothetical protein
VAERPGEDYSLLSELYGNTVQQWGRYNAHVAAIVGGAETQERLGTGVRFTPISRAKQQEAMRYLTQNAFQVRPVPAEHGGVAAHRAGGRGRADSRRAGNVLNTLLARGRLDRVVEYEALAGPRGRPTRSRHAHATCAQGVWTELSHGNPRVDVYRRNLQRAYIQSVERTHQAAGTAAECIRQVRRAAGTAARTSDARAVLRGELVRSCDRWR